jgi:hypothetical protein
MPRFRDENGVLTGKTLDKGKAGQRQYRNDREEQECSVLEALAAGYFDTLDDPVRYEIQRNPDKGKVNSLHVHFSVANAAAVRAGAPL